MAIRVNSYIETSLWKDRKFKVVEMKTGYKKDCFKTDTGEMYFMDNRFKTWKKVSKNAQA